MKIKTEIIQSIYIISCEGPCLISSSVDVFLTAMKGMILKGNMDVLFDLSDVQLVGGLQIDTIFRSFNAIEGQGHLFTCGVNDRDLKLIKLTHPHLDDKFLLVTSRNETLSTLYWEQQDAPDLKISTSFEPLTLKEETAQPAGTEIYDREGASEEEYDELIIVTDDASGEDEGTEKQITQREETKPEEKGEQPLTGKEQRKFGRVKSRQIMDGKFYVFCKSTVTRKHYVATVQDIGIGGLLMTLSPPRIADNEELLLDGRIGKLFKFQETAIFHSQRKDMFVFEFVDLSIETTNFLHELFASLNK